ncbi:unnamed protein product, partial [Larinioides sclopetarius]
MHKAILTNIINAKVCLMFPRSQTAQQICMKIDSCSLKHENGHKPFLPCFESLQEGRKFVPSPNLYRG